MKAIRQLAMAFFFMGRRRYTILFFCLLIVSCKASAQYYLQLKKRNKVIHTYTPGDRIRFKLKGDKYYSDQLIIGFANSTIKFRLLDVNINDIEAVKLPERSSYGLDLLAGATFTGGVLFLAIDQLNQLSVQDEGLGPSSETLLISGSLIGTGAILWLLKKKKFKFKSARYRLVPTDFYIRPG